MNIDQLIDELPGDGSDSVEAFNIGSQPTGPCCEKCKAPLSAQESLVCQKCGWYASVGSYVEIDRSWEVASSPDLATEEDAGPPPKTELPTWAWILGGCVLAVVLESLAVRLLTPDTTSIRTLWSVTQLFVGFLAFAVCHTYCFVLVLKNEADIKLLDYLLRPLKSWGILFRGMPERGWVCYCGLSGLTAAIMSMLVIGAIPYERLLDWNVKEKAKFSLMSAVMSQAQNIAAEDEKSLEEAIGDLAGKAELEEEKKKAEKNRKKKDCIIVGYMANQTGEIQTLLLAAEHYGVLRYAGNVRANDLPEDQLQEITRKLMEIKSHRPFIKLSIDGATWVKPKQLIRVSYRRRGKQGGLYGAKIVDLLGEANLEALK